MVNLAAITERRPYNAASDFVDANVSAGRGSKVAFKEGNRTLTYGDLQKETCRFASGLAALGFGHETRMVMLALDVIEFPIAFWGAIRGGVAPIPLNTLLSTEQYAYMIEDSRAAVLFVSEALAKTVEPVLPRMSWLKAVIVAATRRRFRREPFRPIRSTMSFRAARRMSSRRPRSQTRSLSGSTRRAPPARRKEPSMCIRR